LYKKSVVDEQNANVIRTVDYEDICTTRWHPGHVHEIHMILSNSHYRRIILGGERGLLNIHPRQGAGIGSRERSHVEIKQFAIGKGIWR
jgi:hypothetical protein